MLCRKVAANRLFGVWRPTPFFLLQECKYWFLFFTSFEVSVYHFPIDIMYYSTLCEVCQGVFETFLFFSERTAEDSPPTENYVSTFGGFYLPLTIHSIALLPVDVNNFFQKIFVSRRSSNKSGEYFILTTHQ